jgi:hypothetical protein
LLWLVAQSVAMAGNRHVIDFVGHDFTLYRDAAAQWLAGGELYPADQVAGPYTIVNGTVLYPPAVLLLLVPFAVMTWAWPLWYLVPAVATIAIVVWHRPPLLGWVAIFVTVALWPGSFVAYWAGTPTIWIVAALALATRWPWLSALVLLKPSLAPFALVGIRTRGWWALTAILAIASAVLLPLTLTWVQVVLNGRMEDGSSTLIYSLPNLPLLAVPVVAWATSTRTVVTGRAVSRPFPVPIRFLSRAT